MDFSTDFRSVSGRQALAEALARRWSTDRGGLIGDPNYGENLADHIFDDMLPRDIGKIQAAAHAEALQDERVEAITSVAELDEEGILTIEFTVTDAKGPFTLTVSVDDVTVTLLQVEE